MDEKRLRIPVENGVWEGRLRPNDTPTTPIARKRAYYPRGESLVSRNLKGIRRRGGLEAPNGAAIRLPGEPFHSYRFSNL